MLSASSPRAVFYTNLDDEVYSFTAELETVLNKIQDQLKLEVLPLTHSDSGRILTSKLYDCLEYLYQYNRHYGMLMEEKADQAETTNFCEQLERLEGLKNKLKKIIQLSSLQGLDEIESKFKNDIIELNEEIHRYIVIGKKTDLHLDTISELNRWSRFVYYGTITAQYTTKGLQTFFNILPGLLKNLGRVFPPLIISLDALKNLFDLVFSVAANAHLSKVEKKMKIPITSASDYKKGFFIRVISHLSAFSLSLFIILIFTGVLATPPLGWALSVGVIASEWLANTIIPAWQSWKNGKHLKKEYSSALKKAKEGSQSSRVTTHNRKQLFKLNKKIVLAEEDFDVKQQDATFGLCTILGSILLAFATITPPLYIPALILLVIPAVRNTVLFLNKYLDQQFGPPVQHNSLHPSFATSEIEMVLLKNSRNNNLCKEKPAIEPTNEHSHYTSQASSNSFLSSKSWLSNEETPLLTNTRRSSRSSL